MAGIQNPMDELIIRPSRDGLWEIVGINSLKKLEITYITGMSLPQAKSAVQRVAEEYRIAWHIESIKDPNKFLN